MLILGMAAGLSGRDGVVGYGRGVGIVSPGDHGDVQPQAPELDLLDGRGAKSVAGGQHHPFTPGLEQLGQLGGGGCLAGAIDPHDGNHGQTSRLFAEPAVVREETGGHFPGRDLEV